MAQNRDFIMARLAAAQRQLSAAQETAGDCLDLFLAPEEDLKGEERSEYLDNAIELAGEASRALEAAQTALEGLSSEELAEDEPDLPEGDEFDDDPVTTEDTE